MKKILLLGSGELGKEFVIAAMRAGQYVIACDRYDNAPAMQVADEREVFSMLDGDALKLLLTNTNQTSSCPKLRPFVPNVSLSLKNRAFRWSRRPVPLTTR